jgi:hypothetical protein
MHISFINNKRINNLNNLFLQKKKKERTRLVSSQHQIPDAPTLEEFECLLGESPTNYPKGEGIANMESELHSAAIDTEVYENESTEILISPKKEEIYNSAQVR